jgi:Xaa-Pro aminopeptidase
MNEIVNRLDNLRKAMQKNGIDAFIIPSSDPHQSEYVCDHWKSRYYFSGFSGSAGYLVVLKDYAALWTDSRYFLQAENQLKGSGITLHKQKVPHAPEHVKWMSDRLAEKSTVGIEGLLFSVGQVEYLESVLKEKEQSLQNVDGIVSQLWKDRPPMPATLAYGLDISYAGKGRAQKIVDIRSFMIAQKADYFFVSALDEIAWLLNLRAWDIEFTPVALSYLLISKDDVVLYINDKRVDESLRRELEDCGVQLKPYEKIRADLAALPKEKHIYIDRDSLSWTFQKEIGARKIYGNSVIVLMKAIKNEVEVKHIQNAMIKDGVALTKFFMWLEKNRNSSEIREYDIVAKLAEFRATQEAYVGESFGAIVGFKGNGAIVHYSPDKDNSSIIKGDGMLLIDSGGQYLDGTTDITRTIFLGEPTAEHKKSFTLVLKGNIALQCIQFPEGTTGMQLDTLARMYLWNEGLNYGHGTGHGVGFFLGVHEPPQGFVASAATSRGTVAHVPGMLSSNEPGFYKAGAYGIRIENLMICKEGKTTDYGKFNEFEAVTLFPISTQLVDRTLLDEKELKWLNDYHAEVYHQLSPFLTEEEKRWLSEACKKLA